MRFSEYFKLNKQQSQLDFVDISPGRDVTVFVDPYAITIPEDMWFTDAAEHIRSYFACLVDAIHNKDDNRAIELLSHFGESDDVYLGYAKNNPSGKHGRGVGDLKAELLLDKFKLSKAFLSGKAEDLSDLDFVIEGVSRDNISDLTIAIIRKCLIEYTQDQCRLWNIPMEQKPSGAYWSCDKEDWVSCYTDFPIINGKKVLLVPKAAVRRTMLINPEQFHRLDYLDFIQHEQIKVGRGILKILKGGKRTLMPPPKKELKRDKQFSYSKDKIDEFVKNNPDIFQEYKRNASRKMKFISDYEIEKSRLDPRRGNVRKIIDELAQIPTGRENAEEYHSWAIGAVSALFYPRLRRPVREQLQDGGSKRIDIKMDNADKHGFFNEIDTKHKIKCLYIIIECKNYSDDLGNPELDQLSGRFNDKVGFFGILLCRTVDNPDRINRKISSYHRNNKGTIIVLTDMDMTHLLELREKYNDEEIDNFLRDK